jgi:hypothetical protein
MAEWFYLLVNTTIVVHNLIPTHMLKVCWGRLGRDRLVVAISAYHHKVSSNPRKTGNGYMYNKLIGHKPLAYE